MPDNNIELESGIKDTLWEVQKKEVSIQVHWCPGHMNIIGNEVAGKFARKTAIEAISMNDYILKYTKKKPRMK